MATPDDRFDLRGCGVFVLLLFVFGFGVYVVLIAFMALVNVVAGRLL